MHTIRPLIALALLALAAGAAQAAPVPITDAPLVARPAGAEPAQNLQGPLVVQRVPSGCSRGRCR